MGMVEGVSNASSQKVEEEGLGIPGCLVVYDILGVGRVDRKVHLAHNWKLTVLILLGL